MLLQGGLVDAITEFHRNRFFGSHDEIIPA
jgi:hypothetical protein